MKIIVHSYDFTALIFCRPETRLTVSWELLLLQFPAIQGRLGGFKFIILVLGTSRGPLEAVLEAGAQKQVKINKIIIYFFECKFASSG